MTGLLRRLARWVLRQELGDVHALRVRIRHLEGSIVYMEALHLRQRAAAWDDGQAAAKDPARWEERNPWV